MTHAAGTTRCAARAFTLVELVATMVVVSVLAAASAPLILRAADAYADASSQRESAERLGLAMDRAVRMLREAPGVPADPDAVDIAAAEAQRVELGDGASLELVGSTLRLTTSDGQTAPLARNVASFNLEYLGDDGETDTSDEPQSTRRINITIGVDGMELRASVFLRAARPEP